MSKFMLHTAIVFFIVVIQQDVNGQGTISNNESDSDSSVNQTGYPVGGYNNIEDLKGKIPQAKIKYRIRDRVEKEIEKTGGNEYDAEFLDEKSGKWHRERKVYAVSDGKKLYLNGRSFDLPIGFMEVIEEGYYMIFLCVTPSSSRTSFSELGAVSINQNIGRIRKKMHYCLDTSSGEAKIFNKFLLRQLLSPHPELTSQFESEADNAKIEVQLKYLRLLNLAAK